MAKETEKKSVTGLDQVTTNRKEAEYDLVAALLEAAEYKTADENITEAEIKRNGKFLFSVRLHPLSDADSRLANKKATIYMPNPNGKKLPPIQKDFDGSKFTSWIIYLATVEEDQKKIWGNPQLMQAKGLMEPWESVDVLLKYGEKEELADLVMKISGKDEEDDEENTDLVDYAKN